MATTYEPIATNTLTSTSTSVTFSSIAGTYTDIVVIISGSMSANANVIMQFNGATTLYSSRSLNGNGTAAASSYFGSGSPSIPNPTGIYIDTLGTGTGSFQYIVNIMNYANTTTFKTAISRFGAAAMGTEETVGLYRSTSAITSVTFLNGTFGIGTVFTLYGIKAA